VTALRVQRLGIGIRFFLSIDGGADDWNIEAPAQDTWLRATVRSANCVLRP